jgi:hypothetical protein
MQQTPYANTLKTKKKIGLKTPLNPHLKLLNEAQTEDKAKAIIHTGALKRTEINVTIK